MELVIDSDVTHRPPGRRTLRWIEECCGPGATVRHVRPLGGRAHLNHALVVETRSGTALHLVLRRWLPQDRIAAAEFSPEREIAALTLLAGCDLTTPSLVAADPAGAYTEAPALLLTELPGRPGGPTGGGMAEFLIQLAAALLPVHTLRGAASMPPYVPANRLDVRLPPRWALRPALWERAMETAAGAAPQEPSRFLHRDYRYDNTLWQGGRLSGVVDWSVASYGPPAVDVASMRHALAIGYGLAIAERFRDVFDQVSGGHTHDPYWDLRTVLDLLPEDPTSPLEPDQTAAQEDYLDALLAELGAPTTG
ncbi:phosphotransferase family protein [Actinomadura flavalba]|uniref:phosphotransferase family protein n=1 Tax=Actinomadura flavalba TaxID=1120938 RepID=UPI0012DEDA40|nr:aminoglycoside phosphotransferase family protein [Actinomadura flavalba]